MHPTAAKRPSIRQESADRTKSAILKAALRVFSTKGYAEAGVRDIAAEANANQALIARYFGSKIELFEAALEASFDVAWFTRAGREQFGQNIVEMFFGETDDLSNPVPMLVFAGGDPSARRAALRILTERVVEPLKLWFGEPEAADRAVQLIAVVTGFFTYRLVLPLAPFQEPTPGMRRWLAQTLQEIVDRTS
jgi:AcrR family transcriptional regulator